MPTKAPRGIRERLVWWEPGDRREAGGGRGSPGLLGPWDLEARKGFQECRACQGGLGWMGRQASLGCQACRALQETRESRVSPAHLAFLANLACLGYRAQRVQKATTAFWAQEVPQVMRGLQVAALQQIAAPKGPRGQKDKTVLSAKEENRVRRGGRGRREGLGRGETWARVGTLE